MSTTLTWNSSGNGTNSGTTMAAMMADIVAVVTANAGNAAFLWQVAGSSIGATPYTIVLSRKDGSAGRIGIIGLTSAFTNIQPTLWEQLPSNNAVHIAWFPAGTGSTLSNLNATSGTICGNDTGAPYASQMAGPGTSYAAITNVPFYFDSQEAMYFGFASPGAVAMWAMGAGLLAEDASGNSIDSTFGTGNGQWATFNSPLPWTNPSSKVTAGGACNSLQGVYAATKKQFYCPFTTANGSWTSLAASSADAMLADNATFKAWFAPVPLMSQTKGEGAVLKLRQVGWGPGQSTPFFTYTTTGPTVQARHFCNTTVGSALNPWLTNFKI